jgi:oligoendopeptidase F
MAQLRLLAGLLASSLALPGAAAAKEGRVEAKAFQPDATLARASVPDAYKWNLSPLFENDAAFNKAVADLAAARQRLLSYRGKLADAAQLREALDLYFATRKAANRITLYANLRHDTDTSDPTAQVLSDQSLQAMNGFMADAAFLRGEILALDDGALKAAIAKEPKLAEFKPYLDDLRRRKSRILDPEAERVMSLAGDNLWAEIDLNELPSDYEKTFRAFLADLPLPTITDESGKTVQLTLSSYPRYRNSSNQRVRTEATEKFLATLKQYQHVLASNFAGQIHLNVFMARARGYDTALEAYLDRDAIDPAIYQSLVAAMRANVAPLHRYVAFRKKLLGVDKVHLQDLYPPVIADVDREIPFPEAVKTIEAALAPLGGDYVKTVVAGLDPKNGWLDLYPNAGKESGAFCASLYGFHPYVKLNYQNDFDGLSTLIHEYGHAMHSQLAMTKQPYVTSSYVPFVAEIASTFNEKLLVDHLTKNAKTKAEKLYLLNKMADKIRGTIYRQALFADFELEVHTAAEKGVPLTAEFLNGTYRRLLELYYGPDYDVGENGDIEWAYVPHFYYKYYMFSYAAGLSSGIALAEKVEHDGKKAREAYLNMLASGNARPPLELLRGAGVDLTKPDAFVAAAKLLDRTIAEMEKLTAKK